MTAQNFDYFKFYEDYLWLHVDFEKYQLTTRNDINAHFRDLFGKKVLKGLDFVSAVNFVATILKGTAITPNGEILSFTDDEEVTFAGPSGGQGRWSLVVARKKTELINNITEPLNPTNTVPLNERQTSELVVLDGTLGASAYPATLANDVILFGVKIGSADSGISSSNIDYTVSDYVRPSDLPNGHKPFYDAIIGPENNKNTTHADFNAVVADPNIANIKRIMVSGEVIINTLQTFNQNDKEIFFDSDGKITKGTSATGLVVTGDRVTIEKGRFSGFSASGDIAIGFEGEHGLVHATRFANCTTEVLDLSVEGTTISSTITE